jgi:hypothetical protein
MLLATSSATLIFDDVLEQANAPEPPPCVENQEATEYSTAGFAAGARCQRRPVIGDVAMSAKRTRLMCCAAGAGIALLVLCYWLCVANPQIKVASAFTQRDVTEIKSLVSKERRSRLRRPIAAHDFKGVWQLGVPVMFSRVASIAGFPGPPGGAYVECRGLVPGTGCTFMLFNNTNGWKCDRMDVTDMATARQIREIQRQYAADPH